MTQIKQNQGGTELQDIFFYSPFDLSTILCIIFSLLSLYFVCILWLVWPSSVICDDPSTMPLDISWFMLICA